MPNTYSNIEGESILPSPYEYALMCNGAYFNGNPGADANYSRGLSSDWEKINFNVPNDYGYQGCAYRNNKTKHIVIAHRGTSPDIVLQNIHTDVNLVLFNSWPPYIKDTSVRFSAEIRRTGIVAKTYCGNISRC